MLLLAVVGEFVSLLIVVIVADVDVNIVLGVRALSILLVLGPVVQWALCSLVSLRRHAKALRLDGI